MTTEIHVIVMFKSNQRTNNMEELFSKVMEYLSQADHAAMTIAVIIEVAFRLVPSEKPKSILIMVAKGAELCGKALVKLSEVLNKVIPQKLK